VSANPSPYDLWRQTDGDRERYRELLIEHGHLIPLQPGEQPEPLPCGWPHRTDPQIRAVLDGLATALDGDAHDPQEPEGSETPR
jgi:hypothetical protein